MGPLLGLGAAFILIPTSAQALEPSDAGDLTLSEFMAQPATPIADYQGEWFEVRNNSGRRLDLSGVTFATSSSGAGFTVTSSLFIEDGEHLVFGVNADTGTNGGVPIDYEYPFADLAMDHRDDTLTISYGATTLDEVTWGSLVGWSVPASNITQQANLNAVGNEWANDLVHNWCNSTSVFGGLYATPGSDNDFCDSGSADIDEDGFTVAGGDCNDMDAYVNPDAIDGNRDPYGDANDDANCDGRRDDGAIDDDSDGYPEQDGDCDDGDPTLNPGEEEVANGIDDDCNTCIDDVDSDGDGFTDCDNGLVVDCDDDDGVECSDALGNPIDFDLDDESFFDLYAEGTCAWRIDVDETDADRFPCAAEVPYDGIDQSGDGYDACDLDEDGFASEDCPDSPDPGWRVLDFEGNPLPRDCDDSNPNAYPGGDEGSPETGGIPDGEDNDCNGIIDDPYLDLDGDGFTELEGDCRDASLEEDPDAAAISPGADELCGDGLDNDCNGLVDDGCELWTAGATLGGGGLCGVAPATGTSALVALGLFALARRRRDDDLGTGVPQ